MCREGCYIYFIYGVEMKKLTSIFTAVFLVAVILFFTAGDGWAIASYAKQYGMGCKSCHGFGSSLNDLGMTYKKKIRSSGVSEPSKQKSPKPQSAPTVGSARSGVNSGDSAEVSDTKAPDEFTSESEQPLPETRVYQWKSEDGTMHFTDNPLSSIPGDKKTAVKKTEKNIERSKAKPRVASTSKTQSDKAMKVENQKAAAPVLSLPEPTAQRKTAQGTIIQAPLPVNYEKCMEEFLLKQPQPKNSEAAMQQFNEAEGACASYSKNAN